MNSISTWATINNSLSFERKIAYRFADQLQLLVQTCMKVPRARMHAVSIIEIINNTREGIVIFFS